MIFEMFSGVSSVFLRRKASEKNEKQNAVQSSEMISESDPKRFEKYAMLELEKAIKDRDLGSFMLMNSQSTGLQMVRYDWEALYRYAEHNLSVPVAEYVMKALLKNAEYVGEVAIERTAEYLLYHCRKKNNYEKLPFDIDEKKVMDKLGRTILTHKGMYLVQRSEYSTPFWSRIEELNASLQKVCNYDMLASASWAMDASEKKRMDSSVAGRAEYEYVDPKDISFERKITPKPGWDDAHTGIHKITGRYYRVDGRQTGYHVLRGEWNAEEISLIQFRNLK